MGWILWAIVGAALIHVLEEYAVPGGFMAAMRTVAPRLASRATPTTALVINGAMILALGVCALIGPSLSFLSLSGPALVFVNACMHLGATIWTGRYFPGVISSVLLYIPLSVTAYVMFARAGELSALGLTGSATLGILYQGVPVAYLLLRHVGSRPTARLLPPSSTS